jgi:pre-mRNA-splicing factor CWC22
VRLLSRIRQTLKYTIWGDVYPSCPFTSHARGSVLDKSSTEYKRLTWDALRKSITGIVNRVNVNITNIKQIVPQLFLTTTFMGWVSSRGMLRLRLLFTVYTCVRCAMAIITLSMLLTKIIRI